MIARKLVFAAAVAAFAGWVGWLAYQTREVKEPIVSRSQFAAADVLVRARLGEDLSGPVEVVEIVRRFDRGAGIAPGERLRLPGLAESRGYQGPGEYLLALSREGDSYRLTPPPPSPGYAGPQRPWIYPWSEAVAGQVRHYAAGRGEPESPPGGP